MGKTHASWLLAAVCEERRQRVLLVDADMQANLTGSFVEEADREPGIESLFDPAQDADAKSLVRHTDCWLSRSTNPSRRLSFWRRRTTA